MSADMVSSWWSDVTYEEAKDCISGSIKSMARSFVAVGFYLKHIRDHEFYLEDGYQDIWEFARETYGMSRSTASRWMAINDRFSVGGNSPNLADGYAVFGKSQLQEMLSLPEDKLRDVTPDMTVREIRELKEPTERKEDEEEQLLGQMELEECIKADPEPAPPEPEIPEPVLPESVLPEPTLPEEADTINTGRHCITGRSRSGICGAAAYCGEPVNCCAACKNDCNGRCGWLGEPETLGAEEKEAEPKVCATSHTEVVAEIPEEPQEEADQGEVLSDIEMLSTMLTEEKERLAEMVKVNKTGPLPSNLLQKQKIMVAALAGMLCDLEDGAEQYQDQPELPLMKNNDQRKAFLDTYMDWPVWFEVPQADEVYYRYDLPDGSSIVICRYRYWVEWMEKYSDKNPDCIGTREYLLKPGYHYLHDCRSNRSALVEHLKNIQKKAGKEEA